MDMSATMILMIALITSSVVSVIMAWIFARRDGDNSAVPSKVKNRLLDVVGIFLGAIAGFLVVWLITQ